MGIEIQSARVQVCELTGETRTAVRRVPDALVAIGLDDQIVWRVARGDKSESHSTVLAGRSFMNVETGYYDQETGLLLRLERTEKIPLGEIQTRSDFSDYREVEGMKYPFKNVVLAMGQQEIVTTILDMQINPQIEEDVFSAPESIQKLQAKQQTNSAEEGAATPAAE